jgi:GTP-binding protein
MKKLEAKKIFDGQCEFLLGAHNFSQIPNYPNPEIAFAGASNVGKSSLLNALIGKKVAIVSTTPGRTRQLNFFKIPNGFSKKTSEGFMLIDMPGYGFAKASQKHVEHWQKVAVEYLTKRQNLKRVFLLIDPIKGLKESDSDMINIFNALAISFQIIFTKTDKLNRENFFAAEKKVKEAIKKFPAAYPETISTSSSKGYGIQELQDEIVKILEYL